MFVLFSRKLYRVDFCELNGFICCQNEIIWIRGDHCSRWNSSETPNNRTSRIVEKYSCLRVLIWRNIIIDTCIGKIETLNVKLPVYTANLHLLFQVCTWTTYLNVELRKLRMIRDHLISVAAFCWCQFGENQMSSRLCMLFGYIYGIEFFCAIRISLFRMKAK